MAIIPSALRGPAAVAALAVWLVAATGSNGPGGLPWLADGLLAGVAVAGVLGQTRGWGLTAGVLGALTYGALAFGGPRYGGLAYGAESALHPWQVAVTAATLLATGLVAGAVARRFAAGPDATDPGPGPAVLGDGDPRSDVVEPDALRSGLELELARARRYEHPLSLLLVGIDEWPTLLVRRGAAAAGRKMTEVAAATRCVVRDVDTVSLHGPGVVAILLPETALAGVAVISEKVEQVAAERGGLTVRSGAATYPDDAVTCEELLREAEAALELARLARVGRVSRVHLD